MRYNKHQKICYENIWRERKFQYENNNQIFAYESVSFCIQVYVAVEWRKQMEWQ